MKYFLFFIFFFSSLTNAKANDKNVRFYNFDEMLINGDYKKPQVLYTDTKQKIKFQRLLKLKKSFIHKLKNTSKDHSLK